MAFTYDSDEGYDGPSDEDFSDAGDFGTARPASVIELPPKSSIEDDLATFRQLWLQDVGYRRATGVDNYIIQCELMVGGPVREVFSTVELLHAVLDQLPSNGLRSLAQVNSYLYAHSRSRLFRRLSLGSFIRVNELRKTPHVLAALRELTLSGWDPVESALSDRFVQEQMAALEAGNMDIAVEWFWQGGKSISREVWREEVEQKRKEFGAQRGGVRVSDEEMAPIRRRAQLSAILRTLESGTKERITVNLRSELAQWPYGSMLPLAPSFPSPDSLSPLFTVLTSLTLTFPLSHFYNRLSDILVGITQLRKLSVLGGASCSISPLNLHDFRAIAPAAQANLRHDGCGLAGAPPSIEHLELSRIRLIQPTPVPLDQPTSYTRAVPPSVLKRIALRNVSMRRKFAAEQHDVEFVAEEDAAPVQNVHEEDYPLFFDFSRLAGTPLRLTHLTLRDVSGVVPTTIFLAIRESGPQLQLLDLSGLAGLNGPLSALSRAELGLANKHLLHEFFSASEHQNEDNLRRIAAVGSFLGPPIPPTFASGQTWSSLSFEDALAYCTSLRILRLQQTAAMPSPWMPSIVDTLLASRPPLRVLNWTVGIPRSTVPEGWMDWKAWKMFADKVGEIGEWGTLKWTVTRPLTALEWDQRAQRANMGEGLGLIDTDEEPSTVFIAF